MKPQQFLLIIIFSFIFFPLSPALCDQQSQPTTTVVPSPPSCESQSLLASLRVNSPIDFCGEKMPLDNPDVREQFEREMLLSLWNRPQVILWLKRAGRYFPYIEDMLKKNNMPDDIKYVVIVESSLIAGSVSSKGAAGFWQFIESTGVRYNLKINSDVDERRNFFASTQAAVQYLKDIHQLFKSWTLAAAAYNMGEEGLRAESFIQKTKNFYFLNLPQETERYIFKIVCAKLIISNPQSYGFCLAPEDIYKPLECDSVEFSCQSPIPVQLIAEAADTYFKVIKELNPEIRGYYLSSGKYSLLIPKASASRFYIKLKKLTDEWQAEKNKHTYIVKKGDNIYSIAKKFDVPVVAILIWNQRSGSKPLNPGEQLFIYHRN
ncbi:MAG: transglycosylase SLT domain-containing protein [Desulfobacterales bacterium]|nr:transglycosylase SLT domain-containing protein [Desulfobacterales bacterium]MBF0396395.1 transglycosylase SLT domain-containing protein [Desulfobacterales bacterium]